jgi:hypothetical protein
MTIKFQSSPPTLVTLNGNNAVTVDSGTIDIGTMPSVTVASGTISIGNTPAVTVTSGSVDIGTIDAQTLTIEGVSGGVSVGTTSNSSAVTETASASSSGTPYTNGSVTIPSGNWKAAVVQLITDTLGNSYPYPSQPPTIYEVSTNTGITVQRNVKGTAGTVDPNSSPDTYFNVTLTIPLTASDTSIDVKLGASQGMGVVSWPAGTIYATFFSESIPPSQNVNVDIEHAPEYLYKSTIYKSSGFKTLFYFIKPPGQRQKLPIFADCSTGNP